MYSTLKKIGEHSFLSPAQIRDQLYCVHADSTVRDRQTAETPPPRNRSARGRAAQKSIKEKERDVVVDTQRSLRFEFDVDDPLELVRLKGESIFVDMGSET